MSTQIGWSCYKLAYAVVQGSSGGQRLTYRVTEADGTTPLPDYDGWTCSIVLYSPYNGSAAVQMSPTVTGDAAAKTLAFDMLFTESITANLQAGVYIGGVTMTDPTGLLYKTPALTLEIQSGF